MSEDYKSVQEALAFIQQNLKAPKSRYNKFGKYNYRAQEDILEAVKPLLRNATLKIQDEMEVILDRVYLKAVVTLSLGDQSITAHAYAREALSQSGMADAQITGSTSSYARKYALNGLFLIDDTQDADATNDHGKGNDTPSQGAYPIDKSGNRSVDKWINNCVADLNACTNLDSLKSLFEVIKEHGYWDKSTQEQRDMVIQQKDVMKERLLAN